ncbi:MAG: TPM domain-containing protein [Thermoplasmata archaeon]|nr:TPM domain-containing protein [Thermoplasmata archaeon]
MRTAAPRGDRLRALVLVSGLILLVLASAMPAAAQNIPKVYLYVNDLTTPHTLLRDEHNSLEDLCYQVDSLSTAEIAVVIVNTTQPWGIDMFAVKTFEANGIGKKGRDNGVLLVVSTDERAWRFEVGYGLEGILNDAFVGRVGRDNLTPALQTGDFFNGIYNATYEVGSEIVAKYDPGAAASPPSLFVLDWKAVVLVVGVFLIVAVVTRGRSFLWIGALVSLFTRGRFGGGRSGGGGASGKF